MTSLVSGYEFYKLCKWNYCARYPINWVPEKVQENDFVFLNLDNYFMFLNTLKPNMPKFNLITHNSDASFTKYYAKDLKNRVNKVYSQNCIVEPDDIFNQIPIGFVDVKNKLLYDDIDLNINFHDFLIDLQNKNFDKKYLCYVNFRLENNPNYRVPCYRNFENKNWALVEKDISFNKFYEQIALSKFIPCPIGSGLDTHRIYESLLLNAIPIVLSSPLNPMYKKLPIMIVDSWEQINKEFLESSYEYQYKLLMNWKNDNPDWITSKWWLNI